MKLTTKSVGLLDSTGKPFTVGDFVEYRVGSWCEQGFVAYGEFKAEVFTVFGWYVQSPQGKQVSEGGLHEDYKIIHPVEDMPLMYNKCANCIYRTGSDKLTHSFKHLDMCSELGNLIGPDQPVITTCKYFIRRPY